MGDWVGRDVKWVGLPLANGINGARYKGCVHEIIAGYEIDLQGIQASCY